MKRTVAVALYMTLAVLGRADQATLVVPPEFATVEDDGWGGAFCTLPSVRLQQVYSASGFPAHPITITEIRWRRDGDNGSSISGSLDDVSLALSTTSRQPDHLSYVYSENTGPDVVEAFRGTLVIPPPADPPAAGPRPFDIVMHLDTPFVYDPSLGNLLLDLRVPAPFPGFMPNDGSNEFDDGASRAFSWGSEETVADITDHGADVVQIVWGSDLPAEPFVLHLSADKTNLWPPNGQKVPVNLTAVGETADGRLWPKVKAHITSVTCNEVKGKAAQSTRNPQWVITDDLSLNLVARKVPGRMNFRVYTITVEAEGEPGYTATARVQVVVPPNAPAFK